jgi:hypothetical protein
MPSESTWDCAACAWGNTDNNTQECSMCALACPPPTKRAAVERTTVAPAKKAQVAAPPSHPKKAVAPAPAVCPNGPTVPAVRPMDMVLEIVDCLMEFSARW